MQTIGAPWFTPEQWACIRECTDDPELRGLDYEQWHDQTLESMRIFTEMGVRVQREPIDVRALIDWCVHNRRKLDGTAICAFVSRHTIGQEAGGSEAASDLMHFDLNLATGELKCESVDRGIT